MKLPYIDSKWVKLFKPFRYGNYVNDNTLVQDAQGKWHLIGITSKKGIPTDEKYFVHAEGEILNRKLREKTKVIDTGSLAWAPCIIENNEAYYMFYGPSPTKLAVSFDFEEWFGQELKINGLPPMACHRDHFVIRQNNRFLMYATGINNKKSSICVLESLDLLTWNFIGFALTSGENSELNPSWGAFESPFVVHLNDGYYLFTTYTDCSKKNYHNTLVFFSENPTNFGRYNG